MDSITAAAVAARLPDPTTALIFVGTKVGNAALKAACTAAVTGRLTPEILGEALVSSSSMRAHLQAEAVQFVALRVSLRSPRAIAWFVELLSEAAAKGTAAGGGVGGDAALKVLGGRAMRYQITSFGLNGTVASALTALAVQAGMVSCRLVTSNVQPLLSPARLRRIAGQRRERRRRREANAITAGDSETGRAAKARLAEADEREARRLAWENETTGMSLAQYRYLITTAALSSAGTVLGSGVGAAVGTCVLPGFGTVVGSIVGSVSVAYLPSYLRSSRGPDDRKKAQVAALKRFEPLLAVDHGDGFVELLESPTATAAAKGAGASDGDGGGEGEGPTGSSSRGTTAIAAVVNDLLDDTQLVDQDSLIILQRRGDVAAGRRATTAAHTAEGAEEDDGEAAPAVAVATSLFDLVRWAWWAPALFDHDDEDGDEDAEDGGEGDSDDGYFSAEDEEDHQRADEQQQQRHRSRGSLGVSHDSAHSAWSEMDDVAPPSTALTTTTTTTTAAAADIFTVLGGKLEALPPGLSWAEVDSRIDGYGEDELVLVFRTEQLPACM